MPFTPKAWGNFSTGGTPINAAALVDLETRLSAYTDSSAGSAFPVVRATGGDDTTTITTAINALASTGGALLLPDALYKVTSVPTPVSPKPITIIGGGIDATIIKQFASTLGASTDMFSVGGTFRIRDCTLQGPTAVTSPFEQRHIHAVPGAALVDCQDVRFYRYNFGIWSESGAVQATRCIFDGGDGGAALGSVYTTGILHSADSALGRLDVIDCFFTDNGSTGSNQAHGVYALSGVECNIIGTRFTRLWGTGYQSQHHGGTLTTASYNQYVNCWFGPAASTNLAQGIACDIGAVPISVSNSTFTIHSDGIWLGQNAIVRVSNSTFYGAPSGSDEMISFAGTGITFTADNNDFLGTGGKQVYIWSNAAKCYLFNNRFTGAATQDVVLEAGLATARLVARGNRHEGATYNCYQLASGASVTLQDNAFYGAPSDACVDNLAGSTLSKFYAFTNDFSQTGTSVTLTATPATVTKANNYGTVGYP